MKKIYTLALFFLAVFCLKAQFTYTYTGKPRFQILTMQSGDTLGIINVELFPRIAPRHVRNFDSLVSKQFYDTCAFHRVVPGFVIQGGDPNSRHEPVSTWGFGQAGQPTVKAEFTAALHLRGRLSAARSSNINSATSQFFICVAPAPSLNGQYSVYGQVTSGMNVVDQIVSTPTVAGTQRPVNKIEMFVTYIGSNDTVPLPPTLNFPKNDSSNVDSASVMLKWQKVQDAVFYHLDVSLDSLFQKDTIKSLDLTALQYNLSPLKGDRVYYWRVKANNGGNISTSASWRFRTEATLNRKHLIQNLEVVNTNCDSMNVVVTCQFPISSNSICPHMTSCTIKTQGGMLLADLYYNITGTWPSAICSRSDTLKTIVVPEGYLRIRTNSLLSGDTLVAITDTTILYCATIGMKELQKTSFSAFPNPVQNSFVIKSAGIDLRRIKASVYDVHGRQMSAESISNEHQIEFDVKSLPGGVYTINLSDGEGGRTSMKVIVVK